MLNKEQEEAVNTVEGSVQVIAGAGSGKTTVLVERINNLVKNHGIKEEEILAISFTNASAADLKMKLSKKGLDGVSVGTIHSICKEILESNGYNNLFNLPNMYNVKREIEQKTKEKDLNIEDVLSWISYQKSYMLEPGSMEFKEKESGYEESKLRTFYKIYEEYCNRTESYDFDSWLLNTYKIYENGKGRKWEYVTVDECQDLSVIQHKLVDKFCSTNNIFEVGDRNQAIYSWRGSVPELFDNFYKEHEGTKVINMNTNYRSCNNIVQAANEFIRPYNTDCEYYKDSVANNKSNGKVVCSVYEDKEEEATAVVKKIEKMVQDGIQLEDIAIIYRNNANSDCIESALKKKGIEYVIDNNNSFFDKKEIKGIIAILKLINDSTNDEAFEVLFKECRFYPTTYYRGDLISNLVKESGKKDCSLYEAFMDQRWGKSYEENNANTLIDYLNRLKIQKEKKLGLPKIIENIIKMFKIKEQIRSKYDYSSIDDKLDSLENLKIFAKGYSDINTFVNFCNKGSQGKRKSKKDAITLCTVFKSKGLEWDNVFLIGLEDTKFPSERASIQSEARVFYVGVTRAKKEMYVSSINYSLFYNKYHKGVNKAND